MLWHNLQITRAVITIKNKQRGKKHNLDLKLIVVDTRRPLFQNLPQYLQVFMKKDRKRMINLRTDRWTKGWTGQKYYTPNNLIRVGYDKRRHIT